MLEVDRNAAENLGIVPPSSAQMVTLSKQDIQLAQQSTNGLVQRLNRSSGRLRHSRALPPATHGVAGHGDHLAQRAGAAAGGLRRGTTIFLATLPGATANFASQLSVVRDAKRILLRAEDQEPVTFFVGTRYPIAFSTLSNAYTTQGSMPESSEETLGVGQSPRGALAANLRTSTSSNLVDVVTAKLMTRARFPSCWETATELFNRTWTTRRLRIRGRNTLPWQPAPFAARPASLCSPSPA